MCLCLLGVCIHLYVQTQTDQFFICVQCGKSLVSTVSSPHRLVFSTSTCATGQKTTSSEHALCRPSPLSCFVPGRPFSICSASTSPTQRPRASPALTFAPPGKTGWSWSGFRSLRSFPRISMTSSSTEVWRCTALRALRRMTSWTTGGAHVRSQTGRASWRSCWRCPWLRVLKWIWWFQTRRRFSTVPHSEWLRAKFPTYLTPGYFQYHTASYFQSRPVKFFLFSWTEYSLLQGFILVRETRH